MSILATGDSCEMQVIIMVKHAANHYLPTSPDATAEFRFSLLLFPCIYLFPLEFKGYFLYFKAPPSNYKHSMETG